MSRRYCRPLLGLVMLVSCLAPPHSWSQSKVYSSTKQGVRIAFPADWTVVGPTETDVWTAYGKLKGNFVGCFVRRAKVHGTEDATPEEFLARITEVDYAKLNSITIPDIKIHLFDVVLLGGLKARRVIYSGTEGQFKMGNLVHRTIHRGEAIVVGCQSFQSKFSMVANDFHAILSTFELIPRK